MDPICLGDQYRQIIAILAAAHIPNPEVDAQLFMQAAYRLSPVKLLSAMRQPLNRLSSRRLHRMVAARCRHTPVAYILGYVDMAGDRYHVRRPVLIPRPETEELILWIADHGPNQALHLYDIGCGSGFIVIALSKRLNTVSASAWDLSKTAISLAQENATRLTKTAIDFRCCDFFKDLDYFQSLLRRPGFHLIVSNPPYVSAKEHLALDPDVRLFESKKALVGGASGLRFYRRFFRLLPKGFNGQIVMEFGADQKMGLSTLLANHNLGPYSFFTDMQGHPRYFSVDVDLKPTSLTQVIREGLV